MEQQRFERRWVRFVSGEAEQLEDENDAEAVGVYCYGDDGLPYHVCDLFLPLGPGENAILNALGLSEGKEKGAFYIIDVYGGLDPSLVGPFDSQDERDSEAKEVRKRQDEEDAIFCLDVVGGVPDVYAYTNAFFEDEEDEDES